jgi:hypothetical protein
MIQDVEVTHLDAVTHGVELRTLFNVIDDLADSSTLQSSHHDVELLNQNPCFLRFPLVASAWWRVCQWSHRRLHAPQQRAERPVAAPYPRERGRETWHLAAARATGRDHVSTGQRQRDQCGSGECMHGRQNLDGTVVNVTPFYLAMFSFQNILWNTIVVFFFVVIW